MLARLASEAHALCLGLEVRAALAAAGDGFLLLLAEPGAAALSRRLLVALGPGRARVHVVTTRVAARKARPGDAAAFLDGRLKGARVAAVRTLPGERVVAIDLEGIAPRRLVVECFGARPDALLLDGETIEWRAHPKAKGTTWAPPPPRAAPPDDVLPAGDLSPAVEAHYAPLDVLAERRAERDGLAAALRRHAAKLDAKAADLEGDLAEAARAEELQHRADSLAAAFHRLKPGMDRIAVDDLWAGGTCEIALDPAQSPRQNLDKLYQRARKLQKTAVVARERLEQTRAERTRVAEAQARLAALPESDELPEALAALGSALEGRSAALRPAAKRTRARDEAPDGVRRFTLPSGAVVLVGKTDEDNDRLTFRVARASDVWLHVEGFPGSHVVLRVDKGREPAPPDLLDAARLAVHFSKRRGDARRDVMWTLRKHVRKARGARRGQVLVDRHRILSVDHDAGRIERLLHGTEGAGGGGSGLP